MKNFVRFLLLVLPAISMLAPGTANSETLLQAVRKKNPARVEVLLRELADPNYRDAY